MPSPFYDPYEPVRKPPNFDPTDPSLEETPAPHETAGILRMHRAGWSGPRIMKVFGISKETLLYEIRMAGDDERDAKEQGRKIHDASVPKDTK